MNYKHTVVEVPGPALPIAIGKMIVDGWELVSHAVFRGEVQGPVKEKVLIYSMIFRRPMTPEEIEEIERVRALQAAVVPPPNERKPMGGGPTLVK